MNSFYARSQVEVHVGKERSSHRKNTTYRELLGRKTTKELGVQSQDGTWVNDIFRYPKFQAISRLVGPDVAFL